MKKHDQQTFVRHGLQSLTLTPLETFAVLKAARQARRRLLEIDSARALRFWMPCCVGHLLERIAREIASVRMLALVGMKCASSCMKWMRMSRADSAKSIASFQSSLCFTSPCTRSSISRRASLVFEPS